MVVKSYSALPELCLSYKHQENRYDASDSMDISALQAPTGLSPVFSLHGAPPPPSSSGRDLPPSASRRPSEQSRVPIRFPMKQRGQETIFLGMCTFLINCISRCREHGAQIPRQLPGRRRHLPQEMPCFSAEVADS